MVFLFVFSNFVPNMKTVLIGAGNIATVLGHALYNANTTLCRFIATQWQQQSSWRRN